jgi:hypothetical protein
MFHGNILRACGIASIALFILTSSAAAQTQQKPAKELITGKWTVMIADNVQPDGHGVPGFGPLPKGNANFGTDGRFSFEVMPSTGSQPGISASGAYSLDDAGKTLTLKVEDSSIPSWKSTTQTGTIKFLNGDHLGWTTSVPIAASADFTGMELIWSRAK